MTKVFPIPSNGVLMDDNGKLSIHPNSTLTFRATGWSETPTHTYRWRRGFLFFVRTLEQAWRRVHKNGDVDYLWKKVHSVRHGAPDIDTHT